MKWFIQRLNEPSSHAGFASALTASYALATGGAPLAVTLPALIAGVLAFVKPDNKQSPAQ